MNAEIDGSTNGRFDGSTDVERAPSTAVPESVNP
jgi:hypothetical protein